MADIVVVPNTSNPVQVNIQQPVQAINVTSPAINVVDVSQGLTITVVGGEGGGGSSTFIGLTDTPSAFTGQAGNAVAVNGSNNGLEFVNFPIQLNADWNATSGVQEVLNKPTLSTVATSGNFISLDDTPVNYTNAQGKYLVVDNNAIAFAPAPSGGGEGIALTDLSVPTPYPTPSGNGSLTYNNTTGVFTFTPADVPTSILDLDSVDLSSAQADNIIVWGTGGLTPKPPNNINVTDFNGITDVGSGVIISATERTDIANNKIGVAANTSNYNLLKSYIVTTETDKVSLKENDNNKIDVDATAGSEKIGFTVNAVNTVTIDDTELNAAKVTVGSAGSQFSLPVSDGNSTQVLKTDGSGNVSFADVSYTDITNKPTIPTLGVSKTVSAGAGQYSEGTQTYSSWSTGLTLTAGSVYYWNGSWVLADASAVSTATKLIAVCSNTTDGTDMVKSGVVQSSTSLSGLTNGAPLYLSTTTGEVTATAPSTSTEIVRVVGYVVDAANNLMEFSPSNDWIEIA